MDSRSTLNAALTRRKALVLVGALIAVAAVVLVARSLVRARPLVPFDPRALPIDVEFVEKSSVRDEVARQLDIPPDSVPAEAVWSFFAYHACGQWDVFSALAAGTVSESERGYRRRLSAKIRAGLTCGRALAQAHTEAAAWVGRWRALPVFDRGWEAVASEDTLATSLKIEGHDALCERNDDGKPAVDDEGVCRSTLSVRGDSWWMRDREGESLVRTLAHPIAADTPLVETLREASDRLGDFALVRVVSKRGTNRLHTELVSFLARHWSVPDLYVAKLFPKSAIAESAKMAPALRGAAIGLSESTVRAGLRLRIVLVAKDSDVAKEEVEQRLIAIHKSATQTTPETPPSDAVHGVDDVDTAYRRAIVDAAGRALREVKLARHGRVVVVDVQIEPTAAEARAIGAWGGARRARLTAVAAIVRSLAEGGELTDAAIDALDAPKGGE
ncbi:MAG: hypothetical protein ACHREM_13450 [Polyangiales bacterium]